MKLIRHSQCHSPAHPCTPSCTGHASNRSVMNSLLVLARQAIKAGRTRQVFIEMNPYPLWVLAGHAYTFALQDLDSERFRQEGV